MTDEERVIKYLDRNYIPRIRQAHNDKNVLDEIYLIDKSTKQTHELTIIFNEIKTIFMFDASVQNFLFQWCLDVIDKDFADFNLFLNECEMVLGVSNWEISHKLHGKITLKSPAVQNFIKTVEDEYVVKYLKRKWRDDNIEYFSQKQFKELYK